MTILARDIIIETASVFGIPAHQIYGPSRKREIALARHAACEAIVLAGWPAAHAGRILSRDETTASHSVRQASNLARYYPDFAERRARLVARLGLVPC